MSKESQNNIDFSRAEQLGLVENVSFPGPDKQTPSRIRASTQLCKHVLRDIETFCRGGEGWPSENLIAERLDCSVRTVRRAVARLKHFGLICVRKRRNGNGTVSNRYTIVWSELAIRDSRRPEREDICDKREDMVSEREDICDKREDMVSSKACLSASETSLNPPGGDRDYLKMVVRSLGVFDPSIIDRAVTGGASLDEVRQVLNHARESEIPPKPKIIHGRLLAIGKKPNLILAPWQVSCEQAAQLRKADADHYRRNLQRKSSVLRSGKTENTDALVEMFYDDPPPELVAVVEADCDRREAELGELFDSLPTWRKDQLAQNSLCSVGLKSYQRGSDFYRDELLVAFEESRTVSGSNCG